MMGSLRIKNEITGRHVLYAILAFFLTVTAVDAFMIYKAVSTFGGIETQDAYRKGLQYNQRLEAEKVRRASGWEDLSVPLTTVGSGRYAAKVRGLAEGTWIAALTAHKLSAERDDILYQSKVRVWKAP